MIKIIIEPGVTQHEFVFLYKQTDMLESSQRKDLNLQHL